MFFGVRSALQTDFSVAAIKSGIQRMNCAKSATLGLVMWMGLAVQVAHCLLITFQSNRPARTKIAAMDSFNASVRTVTQTNRVP